MFYEFATAENPRGSGFTIIARHGDRLLDSYHEASQFVTAETAGCESIGDYWQHNTVPKSQARDRRAHASELGLVC